MFLRPFRFPDKRRLQQLYYDTMHHVVAKDYSSEHIKALAPEEPDREMWSQLDRQECFLVEYKQQILGFASMDELGRLAFLYVHKEYQNKGIASTLLKQLERLARKKQLQQITVETGVTAKSFFEAKGFTILDEQEQTLKAKPFITYRMVKKLPEQTIKPVK